MSARSSTLVDWSQIYRRALAGESLKSLAAEFNLNYDSLRQRSSTENWGIQKLHSIRADIPALQLEEKQRRIQLASAVTQNCSEAIQLANQSTKLNFARTINRLSAYFLELPPDQFSTAKINALAALIKSAATLFHWPINRSSSSLPDPSRRQPSYYDITPADLPNFTPGHQSSDPSS